MQPQKNLVKKLGIKPGSAVLIINAPPEYFLSMEKLPEGVKVVENGDCSLDFIQFFTTRRKVLKRRFPALKARLLPDGMLWVSWPKKSSGVQSDLTETIVREIGLANGLVDVKVCAIDEVWSGLKFVYRLRSHS